MGTWVSTCHSIAWVWFFNWDLQGRQSSCHPTGNSHNRCLGWATCGAGRLLALHTLSREQSNIFHWACHAFVKDQHISGEAFTALFTRFPRYKCMCSSQTAFTWVPVCLYLCISQFNSQQAQCGFDYIETSLCSVQRNCRPTMESMRAWAFFKLGLHIISFITMRISFPTF